jgi:hypothetical protein
LRALFVLEEAKQKWKKIERKKERKKTIVMFMLQDINITVKIQEENC